MKVTLKKVAEGAVFDVSNDAGGTVRLAGSPDHGGDGVSLRPMEGVLASLAACSAVDVVHILKRQGEPLRDLTVEVDADRADAVPAVFTRVTLRYVIDGPVNEDKARRAVALGVEKYCSVGKMLEATAKIDWTLTVRP